MGDGNTLTVDQKLVKVPLNPALSKRLFSYKSEPGRSENFKSERLDAAACLWRKIRFLQNPVQGVTVCAKDVHFCEQIEVDLITRFAKFADFCLGPRFLIHKVITGETQDF